MKSFIVAYSFTDSNIPMIAKRDFLITYLANSAKLSSIKVLNPSIRAIFYENALTHSDGAIEDWYVHDPNTGARLVNNDWGWTLMDFGNPAYRTSLANKIKTDLDSNPIFDGVFLDDVWTTAASGGSFNGTIPQPVIDSWQSNMKLLLAEIKQAIGDRLLIINTSPYSDYISLADGQMDEAFGHANWNPFPSFSTDWWGRLDSMIEKARSGKIFLAQAGVLFTTPEDQISQAETFCHCLFLMGASNNCYFNFATTYSTPFRISNLPDVGSPLGDYRVISSTMLARDYSKATVSVNALTHEGKIGVKNTMKKFKFTGTIDGIFEEIIEPTPTPEPEPEPTPEPEPEPTPEPEPEPEPTPEPEPIPPPPSGYVIDDFNIYSPLDIPKPAKGETVTGTFGLPITRITDALLDLGTDYAQPGYPKHDIENADGTMLIVQATAGSGWHIFNALPPYNLVRTLPPEQIGWSRPIDCRWDGADPNVLYYMMFGVLYKYDVVLNTSTAIHDFTTDPDIADWFPAGSLNKSVGMNEEGNPSDDSRYWFMGVGYSLGSSWPIAGYFVYDKDYFSLNDGKITAKLPNTSPLYSAAGNSGMSPDGIWADLGNEIRIFPKDLSARYNLTLASGHADWSYSKEGRLVYMGFALKDGMWSQGYWNHMVDAETRLLTCLGQIQVGLPRYHYSGNNHLKKGWGIVSTYATNDSQGGLPMFNDYEINMIELTTRTSPPARVWRLAKTRTNAGNYNEACFAKLNRRGTKVWFGTRWGSGSYDIYQIDLPTTWYEDLG